MRSRTKYIVLGIILVVGLLLRLDYLAFQVGNIHEPDLGGDPCHHYTIAKNIALGNGPKTDFVFSYWFHHKDSPALTDIYTPGVHYVIAGFMKVLSIDYFSARMACLVLGVLSILLLFGVAELLIGTLGGLIAAGFLAVNATHIEHSTVVMTPVIATFFTLLTFKILLHSLKDNTKLWLIILLGFSVGITHLMQSVAPVFAITYFIFSFILTTDKKTLAIKWPLFLICLVIPLIPWGLYTNQYFGKTFYSNLNFYPLVDSWRRMNYEVGFPTFDSTPGIFNLFHTFVVQFFKKIVTVYKLSVPGVDYRYFIPAAIPLFLLGILYNFKDKKMYSVYLFMILSFGGLTIASRALMWHIWPRHYISTIPFAIIGITSGLLWIFSKVKISAKLSRATPFVTTFLIAWCIYTAHNYIRNGPPSFWTLEPPEFIEAANWIKNNTEKTDRIMYALTPQDLACYTDRQIIIDPSEAGGDKYRYRAAEEISFYGVKYLMISNTTADIYNRAAIDSNHLEKYYPGVSLSEVYSNNNKTVSIYSVK